MRKVNNFYRQKRIGKEMRLSEQIGEYDMDQVILDLGSEANILMRQTWKLMDKPKL